MKLAQDVRAGNVIKENGAPTLILKTEYSRGGRSAATVRMNLKNLVDGRVFDQTFQAKQTVEQVFVEKKEAIYVYFADPKHVFMDEEYNQYEIEKEHLESALGLIEDGMPCEVIFHEGRPIAIELPVTLVREIVDTAPPVTGDTQGKVMKTARLATKHEVQVPVFCAIGDKIEIDTRTNEYRKRV